MTVHESVQVSVGFFIPRRVLFQVERRFAAVPVPEDFVHVALDSDAQKSVLVALRLVLLVSIGRLSVEGMHLAADALEVLLYAELGERLCVLRARLVKQLALDVDVVRPVLGFKKSGLCETRSDRPHQECHHSHH